MKIKTRNHHTMTESAFRTKLQSVLRNVRWWKPVTAALKLAERKSKSDNKRLKYEYKCSMCLQFFPRKEVQIDHIIPVVDKEGFKDWNTYIDRLFTEVDNYQVLCLNCHQIKSQSENQERLTYKNNEKDNK